MLTWHLGFSHSSMVVTCLACAFSLNIFTIIVQMIPFLFGKITTWIQTLYRLLVRSHAFIVKLDTGKRKFYFDCLFALIPHLWNYRLLEFMSTTIFDKVNATPIFISFFTFFLSFLPTNDFSFLFTPNNSSHLNGVIAFLKENDEKESAKQNEKICISAFFSWCEFSWRSSCLGRNFLSCQQSAIINDLVFRNFFGFEQWYCEFLLQAQPEQITFLILFRNFF